MGPAKCPDCPYDRFVAELASPGMRERWAERVNVQWSWGRDGCAWFHLCQKCHLAEWPLDFRTAWRIVRATDATGDSGCRL